ncbi:HlyD family secretion protein [Paenibacillus forsythiae]|uniref:HlyD family secretion protein n=1 Tax=Paenibacillus forsythiae TaxID=365616 RepID=A0ABU3H324_9BACL|nr:HlyD family efflux transporter periplasmic adaptor subunit [Paenibacillus forsythiae]MDT3424861.1 HlyD family secretion protein [Paenibacillus forsythiae]
MGTRRKSKTGKWLVISIIVIAAVIIAGVFLKRPAAASYESVTAQKGDITTYYSFSGNVETKNRQTVMAEKILQISDMKVKEGDTVSEGEVLLTTTAGDEIKSKINGEIVKINMEDNAQVMAGTALLDIVDYNNLELNVKVDEYDIQALAAGKETIVKIGAINKELTGKISSISKEGQVMNGITFFIATIDLAKDQDLRIGMTAEVKAISSKATGVVTLPMTAIQFDDSNQPYVLKEDQNGAEVKTEITTGINDGTNVEVKSGVADGETILYKKAAGASTGVGFGRGGGNENGADGGGNE